MPCRRSRRCPRPFCCAVNFVADTAGYNGKQQQQLHQNVEAVMYRGRLETNTRGNDLEVEGDLGNNMGGCNLKVVSNNKGDPKVNGQGRPQGQGQQKMQGQEGG